MERSRRHVRIYTHHGTIEGWLNVSPALRTLDDLNMVAPKFLVIEEATAEGRHRQIEGSRIALNIESILFVRELEVTPSEPGRAHYETTRFYRSAVRLRVEHYDVHGFLHVPQGDPMTRLNQTQNPFLAVTSATITQPDGGRFEADFLALNRSHILVAEELGVEDQPTAETTGELAGKL